MIFRSTKGASKQRRDLINGEISQLRDLLPLSETARQRLSQLQIMSLTCCYIRKCNYFVRLFGGNQADTDPSYEFSQTMTGFLVITTKDGKLLYISENVTQFLGHSMVDMLTQGDSLYDIIDKKDHGIVRNQLQSDVEPGTEEEKTFFCRMNVSRSFRRQSGFGDSKVMHVRGHFMQPNVRDHYSNQPVFMALCSPLITPDIKENMIQHNTMIYQSVHELDMKFIELADNIEFHLGYTQDELAGRSWYEFVHPEDLHEAKEKHGQLVHSVHEIGCMLTIRLQHKDGRWVWMNIVMQTRTYVCEKGDATIVCTNHVVSENEAQHFKMQSQLYSSHIARSPEFLTSPSGSSPSHTITHVAMERQPVSTVQYPEPHGDDSNTSAMYYHAEIGVALTTAMGGDMTTGAEGVSMGAGNDYMNINSFQQTPIANSKNVLSRQDVINRLKRKMTEVTKDNCKPTKIAKTTHENGFNDSDNTFQGLLETSFEANRTTFEDALFGLESSGEFGSSTQVLSVIPQHMLATSVSRKVALNTPAMNTTYIPLSPAQSVSSDTTDTASMINIDLQSMAAAPSSVLTPESTPANSPQYSPGVDGDLKLILENLEEASMFQDESKPKVVEAKPLKKIKVLPVLDPSGLEEYLNVVETSPRTIPQLQHALKIEAMSPQSITSPLASPQTSLGSPQSPQSSMASPAAFASPMSAGSPCTIPAELAINGTTKLDDLNTISPEVLSSLMNSVSVAMKRSYPQEEFMLVPQQPAMPGSEAMQEDTTGSDSLDDLEQLGFSPSYGEEAIDASLINQTL